MARVKQSSTQKRRNKAAVPALGAAGLTLSLVGSASASAVPMADVPTTSFVPNEAITVLSEEEMADVSLATFHLFDKENVGQRSSGSLGPRMRGLSWLPRLRSCPCVRWLSGLCWLSGL